MNHNPPPKIKSYLFGLSSVALRCSESEAGDSMGVVAEARDEETSSATSSVGLLRLLTTRAVLIALLLCSLCKHQTHSPQGATKKHITPLSFLVSVLLTHFIGATLNHVICQYFPKENLWGLE